jgi:putative restriction endonuclease
MSKLNDLTSRDAVLQAMAEFDRLGRTEFLAKYGFRPARSYFVMHDGKSYDSKAIVGAACGFQFPSQGPLSAYDFSGGDATVRPKLESLGFEFGGGAEHEAGEFTSDRLTEGEIYPREALIEKFGIVDSTVNTGVFRLKGSRSVWLFVTRDKTNDRTQYKDNLEGDLLHWEGQTSGRTDAKIVEHEANGDELLVFYRDSKRQHPKAGFRFEGQFRYLSHKPGNPSAFLLQRVREQIESEAAAEVETFDPTDIEDGRSKVLAAVSRRQGQSKFRRELMRAYEGKCAVTGCAIEPLLEAAHIHPYLGPHTNHVTNGLLLRADIHTLFDLGLLAVDADHRVVGAEILLGSDYAALIDQPLELPSREADRPSGKALEWHRDHRYSVR